MHTHRKAAITVGVLFIIGTVAGVLSAVVTMPVLNNPDYLARIASDSNRLVIGALLVLTMGLALALVPVVLYPIARKHNELLALGYVVFRGALEPITYIGVVVAWLALIAVGRASVAADAAHAPNVQTLGAVLVAAQDALGNVLIIVFGLGALMLYALVYQSRLLPRWLSVWGLVAISMHLATAFLLLFALVDRMAAVLVVLNVPILLQELVMAVWLIIKGFSAAVVTPEATAVGYDRRVAESRAGD